MAITNTKNKIIYTMNGSTTVFPYDFKIFQSSDLVVSRVFISTGSSTTLTEGADYSVSGVGVDAGGNVTVTNAGSALYKLVLLRVIPMTQTTEFVENDPLPSSTQEAVADRAAMRDQQLQEQIDRSVKGDPTSTATLILPAPVDGMILAWDGVLGALKNVTGAIFGAVIKATQGVAEAASNDMDYMTALQTKNLVQKSGAVSIPVENVTGLSSVPTKASQATAEAASDDTQFMTALQVKNEVNKAGAVSIPAGNINGAGFGSPISLSNDTTYLAATDGVVFTCGDYSAGISPLYIKTDASNPPTTTVQKANAPTGVPIALSYAIKKGNYYIAHNNGNENVYSVFIPLGA